MDTVAFSDKEKQTLKRFGFPSHSIYSRGVAEKDDVKRMGSPFYRYRVFKNPSGYILTRRKHSSEREKAMGEEERVAKDTSLESLLHIAPISESNNKTDIRLTESKLRNIIREELSRLTEAGGELEVYAMANPDPKYGGAEYIDVLVKRTGSGVEVLDMAGPPGEPIKTPDIMQYADIMARDIEQGDYLEKLPYDRREIEDRFGV